MIEHGRRPNHKTGAPRVFRGRLRVGRKKRKETKEGDGTDSSSLPFFVFFRFFRLFPSSCLGLLDNVSCTLGPPAAQSGVAIRCLPASIPGVKLSVKSDYAARAVIGLARHYQNEGALRVEDLAVQNGIPANYLVQILIELKARHIVKSVRGKEGGYLLARPPAEISLGDVLRCVHGRVFDPPGLSDPQCPPELRAAWNKLQTALDEAADAITFQRLLDEGAGKEKMYYI